MIKTPLIRPLSANGSTMYVFQSANNDLYKSFGGNNGTDIKFSKFALLNIQDFKIPLSKKNNPQLKAISGQFSNNSDLTGNGGIDLAQMFQNYLLNFESSLLNSGTYVESSKLSTEKIFWKFLKELGAIRFQNAVPNTDVLNGLTRYVEESNTESSLRSYERVVKYLGNVDISNSVSKNGEGYLESYLYLKSNEGSTPCLFTSSEDSNYKANKIYSYPNPIKILGREGVSPNGLSTTAYYDKVLNSDIVRYKNGTINESWFDVNGLDNAYYTDSSFGSVTNDEIVLDNTNTSEVVTVQRNRLDGIEIDWDVLNYPQKNLLTYTPKEVNELSTLGSASDFEYNTILLWYDKTEGNVITRNLYGVVFLDAPISLAGGNGFYIPRFEKVKSDEIVGKNGNSITQRISIRVDSAIENISTITDSSIENELGLEIYLKSAENLTLAATSINDSLSVLQSKERQLEALNTTLQGYINENESLKKRISVLEQTLTQSSIVNQNVGQLLNNLKTLDIRLRAIETGTLSNLVPDLSIIQSGNGINADRSVTGRVYLELAHQGYSLYNDGINKIWDNLPTNRTFEFTVKPYQNYYRISNILPYVLTSNIIINISDDTNWIWKNGQPIKIVFSSLVDLDIYTITFNWKRQNGSLYNITSINSDNISGKGSLEFTMLDNTINDISVEIHQLQ